MKEKISVLQNKIKNLSCQHVGIIMLFVLWGIYLVMQHRLVGLYYDDYGNASLSYGYDSSEVDGTNYSLIDLLRWAGYTYFNWGGRILYALFLIPLIKKSGDIYMFIQSLILLAIFVSMYQIVKKYCKSGNGYIIATVFFMCYGLLQGDILTQGMYWASASVLYVWPILPFMLLILYFKRMENTVENAQKIKKREYFILFVLISLVTLSQEQLGGALLVWLIFNLLFKHLNCNKKYFKLDFFAILSTLVTYAIMFAAPGNWSRLSTNAEYVDKPMIQRIEYGFFNVLSLMSNKDLKYFNLLLLIAGVIVLLSVSKSKGSYILGVGIIPFTLIDLADILGIVIPSDRIREICFLLFLLTMLVLLVLYFKGRGQLDFLALMLSAVASVFCLIFSPAFSLRSCLPYVFICMLFVAIVLCNQLQPVFGKTVNVGLGALLLALGVCCLHNMKTVYEGYESNYYADNYNMEVLRSYSGTDDKVYLLKYDNDYYRSRMSCDEGFEYIDYWVKEYFSIPQSVIIEWKSIPELVEYAKMADVDINFGDGFYQDEGGYRWAEENAQLMINNASEDEVIVHFNAEIRTGYDEKSKLIVYCNGEEVLLTDIDNQGIDCELEITLVPGENLIQFSTDAKKIDSGADARNFYMHFKNVICELIY